jgi:hypothetical protein
MEKRDWKNSKNNNYFFFAPYPNVCGLKGIRRGDKVGCEDTANGVRYKSTVNSS